jgi:hypothetical protein
VCSTGDANWAQDSSIRRVELYISVVWAIPGGMPLGLLIACTQRID